MDKFIKSLFNTTTQNLIWLLYLVTVVLDWIGINNCYSSHNRPTEIDWLATSLTRKSGEYFHCRSLVADVFVFTLTALILTVSIAAKSRREPEDEHENKQKDK